MRARNLSFPLLATIAATRGMLGAGIGMLASGRMSDTRRRAVGRTLLTIGIASTVPLMLKVLRGRTRSTWNAEEVLG